MREVDLQTGTFCYRSLDIVHIKTEANLMTGRSKTIELITDDMIYEVTLVEPTKTTRLACVSEMGAERIFNRFNIDKE